jgi:DNA polymerase III subunit epsilon
MVAGKSIDVSAVARFVEQADLVIAHNAGFDRQFLERFCPAFEHKPWGCSQSQVDWRAEGFEGTRLGYLVAGAGYFYNRHRALNDCYAAIELLATRLPKCGQLAFKPLLDAAREPSWRIWAAYAPFDLKDALKARGYRWNANGHGPKRSWYIDVPEEQRVAELAFLESEIYGRALDVPVQRIDAYDRFSTRV